VLWLSAALAAIAFSLASTVRGETDRAATAMDGARAYYVAAGAIERASMELLWSAIYPGQRPIPLGAAEVVYDFPTGAARVEIIPETAKLNVNLSPPEELYRLGVALGLDPERAREIAMAIDAWRQPAGFGGADLPVGPSFQPPHASFQEIEELLLVKGVTPGIFYGTFVPGAEDATLAPRGGLVDCLSVYGSRDRVDANTAAPAVLAAIGLSADSIAALVQRRRIGPLAPVDLAQFASAGGANRLRLGGNSIYTLRATARPRLADGRLSDLKRTVAAQIKYMPAGYGSPIHVLRWYDAAWSN
jgi:general secretion pathway protein K